MRIALRVNGERHDAEIWEGDSLLFALRERLGFPGSKNACEQGECGSCTVLYDGLPVCACLVLAAQADGHDVVTVEGLRSDGELVCACLVLAAQADGHDLVTVEGLGAGDELHPVQQAFVDAGAVQCGFCTPGLVVATSALLERTPNPSEDEIREALSGNLCRCTGYTKIFDAVRLAAAR
jgi:carbon-monoxide dehydrogenase small subunit